MKKEDINKIICELNKNFSFPWIKAIYSLDKYTILLELYKKSSKNFLIISIKKSDIRFHLLFISKIPKELNTNTPFRFILNSYIKGGQISSIEIYHPYIFLKIKSTEYCNLIINFYDLNIILLNDKGKIISSIDSKIDKRANYLPINNTNLKSDSNSFSDCDNFTMNKSLSEEFINKKTEEIKKNIIKDLKKELKKNQKLLKKLDEEKAEVDNKEYYKNSGVLLKYNLKSISKGTKTIKLRDFYGKTIEISLNPKLSPIENMENFFKRYKKLLNKEKPLIKRITDIKNNINIIIESISNIENLDVPLFPKNPEDIIKEIGLTDRNLSRLIYNSLIEKKASSKKTTHRNKEPFLKLYTSSGKVMMVGRNAKENDILTKKLARGNDLWFHAEEVEGSHVILRYNKRDDNFTEKDIEEASLITAYYSKLRRYGEGNVVYTRCKYLNKPKESKPGFVIYHNNKTIYIKIDENKVKKILNQSSDNIKE